MELIATAKFRKALDRATEAESFTRKIAELVADLGETSQTVTHHSWNAAIPSSGPCSWCSRATAAWPAAITATCSGWPTGPIRISRPRSIPVSMEVSGKRGINFFRYRKIPMDATYTQFEDRPQFHEVEKLADRYIAMYVKGEIDRLDVVYTQFINSARQTATVQTLLPIVTADLGNVGPSVRQAKAGQPDTVDRGPRPSGSLTSSCPTPRASSRRSCRSRSRSGCSSASSTRPSASRSRAWSPCGGPPRTPTTSSSR